MTCSSRWLRYRLRGAGLAVLLALLPALTAWAQEMPVPVDVQQPLFVKILAYERTLQARGDAVLRIGIVYQSRYRESLRTQEALMRPPEAGPLALADGTPIEFVALELTTMEALAEQLEVEPVDALYIAPLRAQGIEALADLGRTRRLLTLTGVPAYVEEGLAVGVGLKEGRRPEILINLDAAEQAGAQFSARLLKLARIL